MGDVFFVVAVYEVHYQREAGGCIRAVAAKSFDGADSGACPVDYVWDKDAVAGGDRGVLEEFKGGTAHNVGIDRPDAAELGKTI